MRDTRPVEESNEQTLRATIVFYDEDTRQVRLCGVMRKHVQSVIDQAGFVFNVPTDREDFSTAPFTDEHARQIGCMVLLSQAQAHPELRPRLELTLDEPMIWDQRPVPGTQE
ncbi:hypothetical protein [Caballeronia sp. LZ019]|uniref:hypothetical protein n=1 Tax=Caballeronia sp. LZ019 TaxID=3038555 RepID=UPI0028609142|nr:hypothetical protein [Caballeronia sp. LZ019]MDR5809364.1 hypothetical protein [Caballeronia sp. LZ019]